jgi:DNA helicase IV
MAQVQRRSLGQRPRADDRDLEVSVDVHRLVVPAEDVDSIVRSVKDRRLPYAVRRDLLRDQLVVALTEKYLERVGQLAAGSDLGRRLRRHAALRETLDRRWPSIGPAALVAELLSNRRRLEAAAAGTLSDDEQRLMLRRRGRAWTEADAPIVDEAKALIAGQSRSYGHVIADEAQDLSPMQLRMLARRCPSGSMTLLGDLAQGTGVWSHDDWLDLAPWLAAASRTEPSKAHMRVVELPFGYRSPGQVLELASRLLPSAAPQVRPTLAVRLGRTEPARLVVRPAELDAATVEESRRLAALFPSVAVIAPAELVEPLEAALRAGGVDAGDAVKDGLARRLTVVSAEAARGLEFDAAVVVEPALIEASRPHPRGTRLLYMALTRPTQHLSIVSSAPLPDPIAA